MSTSVQLIAEAVTPWGRVRVTAWSIRPLSGSERQKRLRVLGAETTAWVGRDVGKGARVLLARLTAIMGEYPDVASVLAEIIGA